MRVVVAGTFGPIHAGHRSLFETALDCGDEGVVVGLTSDEFARGKRERDVPSFEQRRRRLRDVLDDLDRWGRDVTIRRIETEHDFAATDESLDAVVVSEETDDELDDLNAERRERGIDPLVGIVVPLVRGEGGDRISSTRVVAGEIDEEGRRRDEGTGESAGSRTGESPGPVTDE